MMNDCMEFPDTVEEYMEQYKIVDTEEVYTNGIALVPVFRMKQWFAHEKIIRMKHQLDYEDEKSKSLRHYSVITPAGTFQIEAEKIEKAYTTFNLKPELRFIVDDEIIAEFYIEDIYGWFERRDPK